MLTVKKLQTMAFFGILAVGIAAVSIFNTTLIPEAQAATTGKGLRCIAFGPYVRGYDPRTGPHPRRRLIRTLLNRIVQDTSFRCIMTYGVVHGLDYVFTAAKKRKLKVIAILWLDGDPTTDDQSITKGIEAAKRYPKTIIRVSCGSEVRTRHGNTFDPVILDCIDRLRAAGAADYIYR